MRRGVGDFRNAQLCKFFRVGCARRRARSVEASESAIRLGDQRETITTNTGHVRFNDGLHGSRRNGRVDGIAAILQHFDRGACRQRMGGRNSSFSCKYR
jgi:hypothetical protein